MGHLFHGKGEHSKYAFFAESYSVLSFTLNYPEITPLNPPLQRGETRNPVPSPFPRGGLGWGSFIWYAPF
ncbi:hypothetical protein CK510_26340 [Brunnivagina elsteri CCALA 953]|uniref:Uncharacterized protein n=1 Tax=Brunnivagina elsteri CCALA 953 TaxID=987040 RepID=A0A2A2TBT1_9CYAN|nr:hypothetical protein CK510_26340 [Calothrix elsteri CCALA 953]